MSIPQKDNPKKTVREFYGTMFEVYPNTDGWVHIGPTQDPEKAIDIVTPVSKKVCAYCPTDKCLNNIVGESMVFPEHLKDADGFKVSRIKYFDIAKCKNGQGKKYFIIIRDSQPRLLEKGRCIWCKSGHVERLPNVTEARKNLSSPENLKKYHWTVWKEEENAGPDEEIVYGQLIGMRVDEVNTFLFKDSWKCKHCYRVFGHAGDDQEGHVLFNKLVYEVRIRDLKEGFVTLKIPDELVVFNHSKCPSCSTQFNYEACELECLLELTIDSVGFYIAKRRCANCSKHYFVVSDVYDMYKQKRKY